MVDYYTPEQEKQDKSYATSSQSAYAPAAPTAAPAASNSPTSSGSFTNLNSYLDANKGAGEQMAGNVSSGIDTRTEDVKNTGKAQAETFKSEVQRNTFGFSDQDRQAVEGGNVNADQAKSYNEWSQTGGYKETDGTNQDKVFADNVAKTNTLYSDATGYQRPGGRKQLLTDNYSKAGQYSNGMAGLDSFLIGGDQAGVQKIDTSLKNAVGAKDTVLADRDAAIQAEVDAQKLGGTEAEELRAAARTGLGNVDTGLSSELTRFLGAERTRVSDGIPTTVDANDYLVANPYGISNLNTTEAEALRGKGNNLSTILGQPGYAAGTGGSAYDINSGALEEFLKGEAARAAPTADETTSAEQVTPAGGESDWGALKRKTTDLLTDPGRTLSMDGFNTTISDGANGLKETDSFNSAGNYISDRVSSPIPVDNPIGGTAVDVAGNLSNIGKSVSSSGITSSIEGLGGMSFGSKGNSTEGATTASVGSLANLANATPEQWVAANPNGMGAVDLNTPINPNISGLPQTSPGVGFNPEEMLAQINAFLASQQR
jgi:hypothetical protein